jgi:hypothetical protein
MIHLLKRVQQLRGGDIDRPTTKTGEGRDEIMSELTKLANALQNMGEEHGVTDKLWGRLENNFFLLPIKRRMCKKVIIA